MRVTGFAMLTPLLVAVGLAVPAAAQPGAPPGGGSIRLGVLSGMFRDMPTALVQAAATPFRDLFHKQTGLDGQVEVVDGHDALAAKLQAGSVHLGVFHGFEWAWVRDQHPGLVPLAVTIPPRRPQACIVVKADSKVNSPAELKGNAVAVPLTTKAHCHLFLERLAESLPPGSCGANPMPDAGPDETIDAVIAGKAPAALLDSGTLAAYQNNLPGRAALVRVIAQSDPFPPSVIVYRKGALPADTAAKVQSGLIRTKENSQGRAFLLLWKLKGFEEPPAGYDAELRAVSRLYPAPQSVMALPR